jgi:flagellar biosynthetic protein FliQ
MEPASVIEIGRGALITVMTVAGPMLLAGLVVGLAVGIFQAVTQIHEMTLTFIPKILAIVGTLLVLLPWMIVKVLDFTVGLYNRIPTAVGR